VRSLEARVGELERQEAGGVSGGGWTFWVRSLWALERGELLPVARAEDRREAAAFSEWARSLAEREGEGGGA